MAGIRDKRYTYAIYRVDKSELLFDNHADPGQMRNLEGDPQHRATLERFRATLKRRMVELNDMFERCTWYRDHWTKDRNIVRGARGGRADVGPLHRTMRKCFPDTPAP